MIKVTLHAPQMTSSFELDNTDMLEKKWKNRELYSVETKDKSQIVFYDLSKYYSMEFVEQEKSE